jgi:hypothetical protein
MVYCDECAQEAVTTVLEREALVRVDFRFETGGAVTLMNALPLHQPFPPRVSVVPRQEQLVQ